MYVEHPLRLIMSSDLSCIYLHTLWLSEQSQKAVSLALPLLRCAKVSAWLRSVISAAWRASSMSGLSEHRTQHLDHAANALDACLWVWPFLRTEWVEECIQQHSIAVLESLSISIFLGRAAAWVSFSRVSRRFRWISRQWCTTCQSFASGRVRRLPYDETTLAVEMFMQKTCSKCEIEMFMRLVEQFAEPSH